MGLGYFMMILTQFFNIVAWPPFTLVYPLYASIRAVENDKHYQQCLAYWVLFSITTIFESAFANLLIWLPFWPYARGLAALLLVTPYFYGAFYIYIHFIRPCICGKTQQPNVVFTSEAKDSLLYEKNKLFDAAKEQYEESGSKELVKFVVPKDKSSSKYDTDESFQTRPANLEKVQQEWSCALCLVTTTSGTKLEKHLQGIEHKFKEDELRQGEVVTHKTVDISSTINRTNGMVSLESFNQKLSILLNPVARSIRWCTWRKPEFGWTKLNTDGYIDKDGAGFGGLFRDYKGDPICAYASKAPRDNIFLVELWAVWRGLVLALSLKINAIWVESDSISVVNTINKNQPYGPKPISCLKHIWKMLKKFDKYRVTHSWREANRAADHVAKMNLLGSDVVLWPNDFPNSLCKIIEDDAQGVWYRRLKL